MEGRSTLSDPYLDYHAKFVRNLSEADYQKRGGLRPCTMLLEGLSAASREEGADEVGYRNLLQTLSFTTGEAIPSNAPPRPSGFFAAVALAENADMEISAETIEGHRRTLSSGCKAFFERQMEDFIRNQVQEGIAAGRLTIPSSTLGDSRRQLLRAFVTYLHRSSRIPNLCTTMAHPAGEGVQLWPLVYFALRIGALDIAREELEKADSQGTRGIEPSIMTLLSALSRSKGGQMMGMTESVVDCRTAYSKLSPETADPYCLAVMNLLSCAEPSAVSVPDSTLEDFLWSQLFAILVSGGAR